MFRLTGITPCQIPLSLLSSEDCAAICDAQPPPLSEQWRVLPEFRRLLEGVGGWPRPLSALAEDSDASARLELAGGDPKQVLRSRTNRTCLLPLLVELALAADSSAVEN